MKKFKAFLLSSLTALSLLTVSVMMPVAAHAATGQIQNGLCSGSDLKFTSTPSGGDCSTTSNAESSINKILTLVINIFSVIVGVIAVIMIIIGGIRFVLSGGDSANVTSARNTILYAIVGLVIVALAQILVKYVLNRVNNSV
ncbi:MAG: pilin [Candidatus Saccharimonadales bacterium]